MLRITRSAWDCVGRALVVLSALSLFPFQSAPCQEKPETPEQTNAKILQMADVWRGHAGEAPLGPGDVLHIEVFDISELTRDVRINQGGDISFPPISDPIHAQGLTSYGLQEKLNQMLKDGGFVSHPQVSVFVKEVNSRPVSVVGAVARPLVYQLDRPTTLIEVIAAAGGIAPDAGSVVMVTRQKETTGSEGVPAKTDSDADPAKANPGAQTITIRLKDLLESGDASFNIPVHGGDVISIPHAGIIYVTGAVQSPGGFVLQDRTDQITALKAIALAHGPTSTAKLNSALIIRKNPATGIEEMIPVKLGAILARKKGDVYLMADDVLLVPNSKGKKVLYKSGEAMLSITTGLAIVRAGTF